MERKIFSLKSGALSDAGSLSGYGAAYGNRDRGGDVIKVGACQNLDELVKSGSLMLSHEWGGLGVGTIAEAKQDGTGLWFSADFYSDDASQKARQQVKDRLDRGKDVGLSIGYETVKCTWGEEDGNQTRYLEAMNVFEISLVGVPMNPNAGVASAKSFEDEYEAVLAAAKDLIERSERLKALRESSGRGLSETNIARLKALAAEFDGLNTRIAALLPSAAPKGLSDEEMAAMHAAMVANMAAIVGA